MPWPMRAAETGSGRPGAAYSLRMRLLPSVAIAAIALLGTLIAACGSSGGSAGDGGSPGSASDTGATLPDGGGTQADTGSTPSDGGSGDSAPDSGGTHDAGLDADGGASSIQKPGPSAELFASPFYTCVRSFYVSTSGSASGDGSQAHPWQTLQQANDSSPVAGDCINVQPGTYSAGVTVSHGGNLASASGYVVYRCTTLDGCIVTASSAGFAFDYSSFPMPNYVVIDGFELAAAQEVTYGQGILLFDGNEGGASAKNSSHHVWVLNNVIHGYGQSGVQMNDGEFFYVLHNRIYGNAFHTCDAQGSGISHVVLKAFGGYAPTNDDRTNPSPLIGSFVAGSSFFHNVDAWNVVYNNALTQCGSADAGAYDTDANNIIIDTLNNAGSTNVVYPNPTLVAFNVVYNAGGGGVHVFRSEFVTVANNSCFNNYLDPYNQGSARACIDSASSYGNTFINNIAVGIPASHSTCQYSVPPYDRWNNAFIGSPPSSSDPPDTFANNVSFIHGGTSCQGEVLTNNGDSYPCASNKCNTDPTWVDVGKTSSGTETTPPAGANFALAAGSPAIGYGQTQGYLSPQSVDVGACSHWLSTCP
jgi:hypothetical protein